MKKLWVLVDLSCHDCNSLGAKLLDHKPNEDEIKNVVGKYSCASVHIFELEINGDRFDKRID